MSGKSKPSKLTPKQRRFVSEYLVDCNATQAARRAGYSKKTAHASGRENLHKPAIEEELKKRLAAREQRTEVKADQVIKDLAIVAKLGRRTHSTRVTNNQVKALELLGKHFKLFTDVVEHGFSWKEFAVAAAKSLDGGKCGTGRD